MLTEADAENATVRDGAPLYDGTERVLRADDPPTVRAAPPRATFPESFAATRAKVKGSSSRASSSPGLCAGLSFFFPGLGHMLSGQGVKGVALIIAAYAAVVYFGLSAFGLPMLIARIVLAVDAHRIAERRRAGKPVGEWEWRLNNKP